MVKMGSRDQALEPGCIVTLPLLLLLLLFSGFFDLISEGTDVEIERNTEENFQG